MANSFLIVSYVSTNILFLRICLALASLCFALWGGLILDIAVDTVIWNAIFFAINSVQAAIIVYGMIPITFDQPELETIYTHFFEGDERSATLSRNQFKPLADMAQVMIIPAGTIFAGAGTVSDHLSLLLTGEMVVIRHRADTTTQLLTQCREFDFLDSPEWIARKTSRGSRFEVTIKTTVACRVVRWSYAELERCMKSSDGTLRHTLNSLIGQDLANKVFASNRSIWTTPDSPHVIAMRRLSNPGGSTMPRIALTSNSTSTNSGAMEHVYSHSALANEGTEREQSYSQPPDVISQREPSQSQSEFDAIVVHGDEQGIYGSFGNTMSSSVTTAAGATTSKDYKN